MPFPDTEEMTAKGLGCLYLISIIALLVALAALGIGGYVLYRTLTDDNDGNFIYTII